VTPDAVKQCERPQSGDAKIVLSMNGNNSTGCRKIPVRLIKAIKLGSPLSTKQTLETLRSLVEAIWVTSKMQLGTPIILSNPKLLRCLSESLGHR
jgi:hypothetical protein